MKCTWDFFFILNSESKEKTKEAFPLDWALACKDEQTAWVRVQDRVMKFTILLKRKREKSKVKPMDFYNVHLNDLREPVGKNPWESLQAKRS